MAWFTSLLAAVSLGLGLLHLVRLVTARHDGRSVAGEASHAVMGLGMAAMFSPVGDPVPAPVWVAAFGVSAAWFAAAVLRSGPAGDDAGHHVVCGVAMLFMLAAGMSGRPGGHEHEHAAAGWVSLVAIVLAGYFAWHVMRCGDRFLAARAHTPAPALVGAPAAEPAVDPGPAACGHGGAAVEGRLAVLRAPQAAAVAHLVMAASMAAMLLGMI
jgi:hypothetical protein